MTTTVPLGSPGLQEMDGASNYFTNREVNGSVTSLTSSPAQSALEALKRSRSSTVGGHTPAISRQTSIRTQTRGNTMRHSTRDASTSFDAQPPYIPELSASQRIPASSSLEGMPRSAGLESEQQWPGQLEAKVVILGSQGVGKTSLVTRYTTGQFSTTLSSTIGASFMTKRIVVPGCRVRLQIWDTAGQERFRSMAPIYYRGSQAAILVYDITNKQSFQDVKAWLQELRENMPNQLVVHVVGSKVDLQESRQVDLEDARTSLQQWIREDASSPDGSRPTSPHDLSAQGSPASPVTKMMPSPPPPRLSLSFSQSRKDALQSPSEPEPWCRADISEVSAKDDFGIEEVFFSITQRLVALKNSGRERPLRSRDSVILDENDSSESRQSWGCC